MTPGLKVRALRPKDRDAALAYLGREHRLNLALIDLVLRLGRPASRLAPRPELVAAWQGSELAGVAALRPSLMLDARAQPEALEALFPHLGGVGSGLVKSTEDVVGPLWEWLSSRGHKSILDRIEIGYAVEPGALRPAAAPVGWEVRSARAADLDSLVEAARRSLLEEDRPDPSKGDPDGFRRWVHSRLPRATVAEGPPGLGFVAYGDVQCQRGWLLQGVYTWPESRRRGLAAAGVSQLCAEAFGAGADHVQLAVVDGNEAAERLYGKLGFDRYARLRTLLFA
ncbi:MAG: hypothetical protein CL910_05610 [Deltaproteobacteria bacterium]|jgi:RimJ/RimL family protein N-acetyltransferase|nr:hypothetical protein [Deltaproteobacteria bacterium]